MTAVPLVPPTPVISEVGISEAADIADAPDAPKDAPVATGQDEIKPVAEVPEKQGESTVLPRQDSGEKVPGLPRQHFTVKPLKERGVQWRRSGKTGWVRWQITHYKKPDGKKAQHRRYLNYVSDKTLARLRSKLQSIGK